MIDEMEMLRSANDQKVFEIKRINGQLNKALEVINDHHAFSFRIIFFFRQ